MRCFALVQPQYAVNRALAAGREDPAARLDPAAARAGLPAAGRAGARTRRSRCPSPCRTPHLASYLATYRAHFGLPPCGQPSGCLRDRQPEGQGHARCPPSSLGTGWDVEATLDVSMISAACPHCKILVVEANSPSVSDLARDRRHRGPARRPGDQQQLRHPGERLRQAYAARLRPSRPHDRRLVRRLRLRRRQLPGQPGHRDRGRRHHSCPAPHNARGLDRAGLERPAHVGRRQQRLLGLRAPSRPGSTTRTARAAPSPTSPPWPPNIPIYNKACGRLADRRRAPASPRR